MIHRELPANELMDTPDDALRELEDALDAEARRASDRVDVAALQDRVRRAAGRPARALTDTIAFILVSAACGIFTHLGWMMALGLGLTVLPAKIQAWREAGPDLERLDEVELLAFLKHECMTKLSYAFLFGLADFANAVIFAVVAIYAHVAVPGLLVAALLFARGVYQWGWRLPRVQRVGKAFE